MNRFLHRLTAWAFVGMLVFASACDLTDLNDNPNQPTTANPTTLLPRAQYLIAATTLDDFNYGRFSGLYSQYWTQNQYTSEDRYGFPQDRATSVNAMWNNYYLAMNNLQEIIRLYDEDEEGYSAFGSRANFEAIVLILQAYTYHHIVDTWGPAPFSEALQQLDNPVPAYDSAQDIYAGLLEMLTRADGLIDVNGGAPTGGDIMYGSDMANWKRFANSLKMRVAMRIADVEPGTASTAIQQAIAAGPFTSNSHNALFQFTGSPPYQNRIFLSYQGGRDDWAVTNTLVDYMQSNNDPRLPIYADPSDRDDVIVGFGYGQSEGAAQAQFSQGNFSRPGAAVRQATSPHRFMLYDEVLFIRAEAVERGFISGDAEALFRQAVEASALHWGVSAGDASSFAASVSYDSNNWNESIGRQKWVALYMQGIQGWSEWRRLDFGLLTPPVAGPVVDFGRPIAIRMSYPIVEQTLNAESYSGGVSMLGGPDNQGTPLFWDVNP